MSDVNWLDHKPQTKSQRNDRMAHNSSILSAKQLALITNIVKKNFE
jgi:hypothetical protein